MNMGMGMGMGGPTGGPPIGMNLPNGATPRAGPTVTERTVLNTYIYDYFLKNGMIECARSLYTNGEAEIQTQPNDGSRRTSPSRRAQKHEEGMNGIEDNSMETGEGLNQRKTEDGDDGAKRGEDLPTPKVPSDCPGVSFLFDWWCLFWDMYSARNGGKPPGSAAAVYVNQTQAARRMQQEQLLRQMNPGHPGLMGGQVPNQMLNSPGYGGRMMMPNGVMHDGSGGMGDMAQHQKNQLVRQAMLNNNNNNRKTPQQISAMKNHQLMQQMQRGEGDNDMNGQQPRPQSPATPQNTTSPSQKRIRLDNGEYQQVGGNGRGTPQGVQQGASQQASHAHQVLIANGINPNNLTASQFAAFQGKAVQNALQGTSLPRGMSGVQQNTGQHGSPMMPQTSEGAPLGISDFYATTPGGMRGGLGTGTGNHALQDYQMQLMLLEQQNKKRLMMARAEQDNIHNGEGQRRLDQPGFQSMSPGSRAAPSADTPGKPQMTGTPKMGNQVGPGSPLPDGQMAGQQQRNSPAFNGQMPQDHQNMMYKQMNDPLNMMGNANAGAGPNGAMMRPPSSHPGFNGMNQAEMQQQQQQVNPNMARVQAGRGQPGAWQQQQHQAQQQAHIQAQQQAAQQQAMQMQIQQQGGPQQQGQPQQVGTPQQARQTLPHQTSMPPPSAPTNAPNNGRTQPSSPQVTNQQPPTPTQSHKPPPKGKAARETAKKQRPNKKGAAPATQAAAAVTPSSEPPTPTTPITPQHPNSFTGAGHPRSNANFTAGGPGQGGNGTGQPQSAPNAAPAAPAAPIAATEPVPAPAFGMGDDLALTGFDDFTTSNADTLLDNFDFDSFLNNPEDNAGPLGFNSDMQWSDSVEAGAGES